MDIETGEIYCLLPLAERVEPAWEKVDVFDTRDWEQKELDRQARFGPVESPRGFLDSIRIGRWDSAEIGLIRFLLDQWISCGKVEALEVKDVPPESNTLAEWFKDNVTNEIFGLIHNRERDEFHWEKYWRVGVDPDPTGTPN